MLKAPRSAQPAEPTQTTEEAVLTAPTRAMIFLEDYRTQLIVAALAVLAIALAVIGFQFYQAQQAEAADEQLGAILGTYESGSFEEALNGTGSATGLVAIADEYGSTPAGNLATFYAADALFQLGRYDEALEYFQDFDKDGGLFSASAFAGEAAIYEQQGDHARAASRYEKAADTFEADDIAPEYLMDAAAQLRSRRRIRLGPPRLYGHPGQLRRVRSMRATWTSTSPASRRWSASALNVE